MDSNSMPRRGDETGLADELCSVVNQLLGCHVRRLSIDLHEGGVLLRGICDSFHAKQMAQEIVSKSTSLPILANMLVVDAPPKDRLPIDDSRDDPSDPSLYNA